MKRTRMPQRRAGLARSGRLPFRSKKTAALYRRVRGPLVAEILAATPRCEYPQCWRRPTDVHEVLRRSQGASIVDREGLRALCRPHHDEVTFHPRPWMYEHGLLQRAFGGGVPVVKIPFTTICDFCRLDPKRLDGTKTGCGPCRIHEDARLVTFNAADLP